MIDKEFVIYNENAIEELTKELTNNNLTFDDFWKLLSIWSTMTNYQRSILVGQLTKL